ncbi:MAG TPA: hypothetical protein V6C85_19860 [Allocoleopsis sp.]
MEDKQFPIASEFLSLDGYYLLIYAIAFEKIPHKKWGICSPLIFSWLYLRTDLASSTQRVKTAI